MMQHPHSKSNKVTAAVGLASLLFALLPITIFPAYAQSAGGTDPNQGLPPGTVGGGSRGGSPTCSVTTPLMAFMPDTNRLKTVETKPTLWIYLPNPSSLTNAEFLIYDQDDNAVVDTIFSVAGKSGLLELDLRAIAQAQRLHPNQDYRWFFSLICPDNRAADISVDGWLQLTGMSPILANQISRTNDPIEQANLYLKAGMWSEALSTLVTSQNMPAETWSLNAWNDLIAILSPVSMPLDLGKTYQLTLTPAQP